MAKRDPAGSGQHPGQSDDHRHRVHSDAYAYTNSNGDAVGPSAKLVRLPGAVMTEISANRRLVFFTQGVLRAGPCAKLAIRGAGVPQKSGVGVRSFAQGL
jgi:hypothetical protein